MKPIALVGISGAGKTTVGRRLAARLCLPFADTDELAEEHMGATIPEVFNDPERGEGHFRAVEAAVICRLLRLATGPMVIAVAGGAVVDPRTRKRLAEHTEVVWLNVPADVAYWRTTLEPGARPLLTGNNGMAKLKALAEDRRPYYRLLATTTVDATYPPDAIVGILAREVGHREA